MIEICGTTACFPGLTHSNAVKRLYEGVEEVFGPISTRRIQLCPQNSGRLSEFEAASLRTLYPGTQFRLHANVRVLQNHVFADASNATHHNDYWLAARGVAERLCSTVWTIHAGRRALADLELMKRNVLMLEDFLGIGVAVEGLYPDRLYRWLINSWYEYGWLLQSGLKYAIDMSHLHIVHMDEGYWAGALVDELLTSENCVEIHVSTNDGVSDDHEVLMQPPYWWEHLAVRSKNAVIFTEGNQLRARHGRPVHAVQGVCRSGEALPAGAES